MSFYIYTIGSGIDFGSEVDFFKCESDFQKHLKKLTKGHNKIMSKKLANSLVEIISFLSGMNDDDEEIKSTYDKFRNRFGEEKITSEFPDEQFNNDLIEKIKLKIYSYYTDAMDAYYSESGKHDGGIDWYKSGDEELRRIDNEDGGAWRIGKDFG